MKQLAKDELDHINGKLNEEVMRAKQRIEDLQKKKEAVKQIYENICALLGVSDVVEMKDYSLEDVEEQA